MRQTCYERESYEYARGRYAYSRETYCDTGDGDDCFRVDDWFDDDPLESLHCMVYSDSNDQRQQVHTVSLCDISPHDLGVEGESIARDYLERRGWEIVESNWTCPAGEADIIARDGNEYVFVEVKTRLDDKAEQDVEPELAVGKAKQKRYKKIAECFMAEHPDAYVRFDIIAISVDDKHSVSIRHLVDAFGCDY